MEKGLGVLAQCQGIGVERDTTRARESVPLLLDEPFISEVWVALKDELEFAACSQVFKFPHLQIDHVPHYIFVLTTDHR